MTQQNAINVTDNLLRQAAELFKQADEILNPYDDDNGIHQLKALIPHGSLRVALNYIRTSNGH